MTSGLEWTEPLQDAGPVSVIAMEFSPDWVKFILDRPMSSAPGEVFDYNSGNPHLLSAILAKLTGMSALEYAKSKLFGPLGINQVYWREDPQGISIGGYGLYLQPRDMAKIGYLYLRNGVWEGKQLLPSAWIDKVSHATVDMHDRWEPELRYSNLFWAFPDKHVYMAVGRYGQRIMVFRDLDVVAVTTGRSGDYPLSKLSDYISSSVKSDTALPADTASDPARKQNTRCLNREADRRRPNPEDGACHLRKSVQVCPQWTKPLARMVLFSLAWRPTDAKAGAFAYACDATRHCENW